MQSLGAWMFLHFWKYVCCLLIHMYNYEGFFVIEHSGHNICSSRSLNNAKCMLLFKNDSTSYLVCLTGWDQIKSGLIHRCLLIINSSVLWNLVCVFKVSSPVLTVNIACALLSCKTCIYTLVFNCYTFSFEVMSIKILPFLKFEGTVMNSSKILNSTHFSTYLFDFS